MAHLRCLLVDRCGDKELMSRGQMKGAAFATPCYLFFIQD